jgi:hypothetical protein
MTLLNILERLPPEIWLVPPVIILGAILAIGMTLRRLRLRRYDAIAARTGLEVTPRIVTASEVGGTFAGRSLTMSIASRQRPTIRKNWTLVTVEVKNPAFVGLHMRPQDLVDTALMAVGGPDVLVGDAEFDRRFVIHTRDKGAVINLFHDRELRDLVVRAGIDSIRIGGSTLFVYYAREERDPEHAHLLFTAAARLADRLDTLRAN